MKVACLFVMKDTVYRQFENTIIYDLEKNALTYSDNYPIVAHPPCQLWGSLAFVNYARYGGDHNKPGNDGGLFEFALNTVRRCGGVIEHPAKSRAWDTYGLTRPSGIGWQKCIDGGWVCEVWQSAYGHKANKATWLYCYGSPLPAIWDRPIAKYQIGFHDQRGKQRNKPTLSKRDANATPIRFAKFLIDIAIACYRS